MMRSSGASKGSHGVIGARPSRLAPRGAPLGGPAACQSPALCVTPARLCAENHRDPHFSYLVHKVLDDLKMLFKTKDAQCFVFPGATPVLGWCPQLQWCHN
jgi:hypothetical protein